MNELFLPASESLCKLQTYEWLRNLTPPSLPYSLNETEIVPCTQALVSGILAASSVLAQLQILGARRTISFPGINEFYGEKYGRPWSSNHVGQFQLLMEIFMLQKKHTLPRNTNDSFVDAWSAMFNSIFLRRFVGRVEWLAACWTFGWYTAESLMC